MFDSSPLSKNVGPEKVVRNLSGSLYRYMPGHIAQSIASLISIPARLHSFKEIEHGILFTVFLLLPHIQEKPLSIANTLMRTN